MALFLVPFCLEGHDTRFLLDSAYGCNSDGTPARMILTATSRMCFAQGTAAVIFALHAIDVTLVKTGDQDWGPTLAGI